MIERLCLFAHFDAGDRLADYVVRYLGALRACGFEIVFVTTSRLDAEALARLAPLCRDVIQRENRGLDFGSWQEGFARYGAQCEKELLFANDSVYGPIGDLGAALDRLRALPGTVRGFVKSMQIRPHLQSWFLLFSPAVFRSPAFQRFMAQDFAGMTKTQVIERGETGLLDALAGEDARLAAFYEPSSVYAARVIAYFNPTHTLWRELIEIYGVPFVKVELLRDNNRRIHDVGQWRDVVNARSPELTAMIEAHRDAAGRDWAGRVHGVRPLRWMSHEGFARRDEAYRRASATKRRWLHATAFAPLAHGYLSLRRLARRLRPPPQSGGA